MGADQDLQTSERCVNLSVLLGAVCFRAKRCRAHLSVVTPVVRYIWSHCSDSDRQQEVASKQLGQFG